MILYLLKKELFMKKLFLTLFLLTFIISPSCEEFSAKRIVINEIMYNPKVVGDSYGEYIELYNAGTSAVNINGWVLSDEGSDFHVITCESGELIINPRKYLLLARNDNQEQNGGFIPDYKYSNFSLTNTTDSIILSDAEGNVIDHVTYKSSSPWPTDTDGKSIELIDPSLDNSEGESWLVSTEIYGKGDYGTPGGKNSVTEGRF